MFENNCIECWDWIVGFLQRIFTDTSLEGLSKSLIVLVTFVIISYGIFSVFSYVGNIGANLVRKAVLPVALITLLLLSLTVLAQYRKDKPCKFSAERYLTECISKKSDKPPKSTWEDAVPTPPVNSWGAGSTPPETKSSAIKSLKIQSIQAPSVAKKNCDPPPKSKTTTSHQSGCETTNRSWEAANVTKPKERDYSKD